jgi:hypothetical protein
MVVARPTSRSLTVYHQGVSFAGVPVLQKRLNGKTWYFAPKTSSKHTRKWAPVAP